MEKNQKTKLVIAVGLLVISVILSKIAFSPIAHGSIWILILAALLDLGFGFSLITILLMQKWRSQLLSKPKEIAKIWVDQSPIKEVISEKFRLFIWVCKQTIFVAYLYAMMEWIFYATKLSFLTVLSFQEKIGVLLISGFVIWVVMLVLQIMIFSLDLIFSTFLVSFNPSIYYFSAAFLLTGLVLILFDNFTYTVLRFGIVTTTSAIRILYALLFLMVFGLILKSLVKNAKMELTKRQKFQLNMSFAIIIAITIVFAAFQFQRNPILENIVTEGSDYQMPNIILVGNDGVNAENMSLYGYERETTPYLEMLASKSLLMLNNFTNANSSSGSDTALLTGKTPFETRVIYPPNTLEGIDAIEHLPGLLHQMGYETISLGMPYYVDVGVLNFQNAFDSINFENATSANFVSFAAHFGYNHPAYFLTTVTDRLMSRVLHIFYIEDMDNPYLIIADENPFNMNAYMEGIKDFLFASLEDASQAKKPLFAHIHLFSTHGPKFYSEEPFFSLGEEQTSEWMTDFYDDSILDYDQWVNELVNWLKNQGYYDNTLIVFYSDHAEEWSAERKVPLMIHFPNDEYAGEVVENTQNIDVAPTVLDYMGVEIPEWMEGRSLLGELNRYDLLYSAQIASIEIDESSFNRFGYMNVIQCQYLYKLNLDDGTLTRKEIVAYFDPCPEEMLDDPGQIWASAIESLRRYGFTIPDEWKFSGIEK